MLLSVLDQSPIAEGSTGAQALRNTIDLARLDRSARLPPLLGGRAPRRTDARRASAGGADRADRVGDRGDPGRLRRRDAAPLQPVQGRRVVHDPGGAVPRPDRPRPRARVGHRPADDLRAAARPPPGLARRLPAAAGRAARLLRGRPARRPPVPPPRAVAARAARAARAVAARLVAAERDLGRRARAPVRVRRLHQPGRRRRSPRPTASASSRVRALQAPRTAVAAWVLCAADRRGGRVPGVVEPDGDDDAAPRRADRGAATRAGGRSS